LAVRTFEEKLEEHELATAESVIEAIIAIWESITFDELQSVFAEWIHKLTWVTAESGEYYTE
jgi:hypothetical protein